MMLDFQLITQLLNDIRLCNSLNYNQVLIDNDRDICSVDKLFLLHQNYDYLYYDHRNY
jgi:hypothetical protein